jgi:hypothetical protein
MTDWDAPVTPVSLDQMDQIKKFAEGKGSQVVPAHHPVLVIKLSKCNPAISYEYLCDDGTVVCRDVTPGKPFYDEMKSLAERVGYQTEGLKAILPNT